MPVTKKKGAIFAIYADSPDKLARGRLASSSSAANVASSSSSKAAAGSPSKRAVPRKALATIQYPARGFPSSDASLNLKGVALASSSSSAPVKPPAKALSAKPLASKAVASTTRPLQSSTAKPVTKRATSPAESPAKRTRPVSDHGAGSTSRALPDSPAARTRSKTGPLAPGRLDGLGSAVPVAAASPTRVRRATIRAENDENDPSLLFASPTPRRAKPRTSAGAAGTPKAKAGPALTSGKTSKTRAVIGDGPLADVSEAYGATGVEPAGFRDVTVAR